MLAAAAHFARRSGPMRADELARGSTSPRPAASSRGTSARRASPSAALLSGTRLLVPRTRSEHATCAAAECPE